MNATDKLMEAFASKLRSLGLPIRAQDNRSRLELFEEKLPKQLPQSFASFLSRYSFPSFDLAGISLFGWESEPNSYNYEASAAEGSLSELLIPAGSVQIGQPDTGSFDAVCFALKEQRQNRECRIVKIDHEQILCYRRVRVSGELWPSFLKLVEGVISSPQPQLFYEDPES